MGGKGQLPFEPCFENKARKHKTTNNNQSCGQSADQTGHNLSDNHWHIIISRQLRGSSPLALLQQPPESTGRQSQLTGENALETGWGEQTVEMPLEGPAVLAGEAQP